MRKLFISAFAALLCITASADEGMWMVNAINSALEKKMHKRGLALKAKELYNADAEGATISDAIVSMEFCCTGSFISDKGLLITNHHCAYSDVHALSTPQHNYLEEGFWARTAAEEKPIKGKKIFLLKKVIDATEDVAALEAELKAAGKPFGMRKISFVLEDRYSKEYGCEAMLSSMWSGTKYYVGLYEVYNDVRLVAAPPVSMAAFGGDIDNWEWPQHKCDFALYRVYTAPDGSPATYSKDNIPLKPKAKLKVSTKGYKPGDFTMVMGYPGRTSRYSSSMKTDYLENLSLPISNEVRGREMEIISRWMNSDDDIRLKYSNYFFSLSNVQELQEGEVLCFRRFGVADAKRQEEKELQAWIDSDPSRQAEWGTLLSELKAKYDATAPIDRNIGWYRESIVRGTRIAGLVNRMYGLRNDVLKSQGIKPVRTIDNCPPSSEEVDCCANFKFLGENYGPTTVLRKEYENISLPVEKELFLYAVNIFYRNVDSKYHGPYQKELSARFTNSAGTVDYDALANYIWDSSYFGDLDRLHEFLETPHSVDEYHADPMYRFMQDIRIMSFNKELDKVEGDRDINSLTKQYIHAIYQMRAEKGVEQYPDANSTMRITYGTVGELSPSDAVRCSWHSTTQGLLEKHNPSVHDFCLNDRQKTLLEEGEWGRWAAKDGQLYVNFLTDNDITGGNSGSPVMNARGELIGLAFDGNKESLASDAYYVPGYNKCVCVDIRYVLWALEHYAGMDYILDEIGVN